MRKEAVSCDPSLLSRFWHDRIRAHLPCIASQRFSRLFTQPHQAWHADAFAPGLPTDPLRLVTCQVHLRTGAFGRSVAQAEQAGTTYRTVHNVMLFISMQILRKLNGREWVRQAAFSVRLSSAPVNLHSTPCEVPPSRSHDTGPKVTVRPRFGGLR